MLIPNSVIGIGDPLTMPFYALAVIPLIQRLPSMVKQARYADGASACDFC